MFPSSLSFFPSHSISHRLICVLFEPITFLFADVMLFCIKANFTEDAMLLLFGEDNGVRGVLLNAKSQIPLLRVSRAYFFLVLRIS